MKRRRFPVECHERRSREAIRIHVRLLLRYIGHLQPHQIHDATLEPLIADRIASGASATTINRTLEVARTILTRAARSYRDADGRPWLEATPPLLTMLPESRRSPYPLTWDEQDRLFPRLPAHLQPMALFAVNTGRRNDNVCGLEWNSELDVSEIGRSVFIVPAAAFKSRRDHVVILSDATWSIVQARRGLHPVWVFQYHGHRIDTMNNNGWQKARREVGLRPVRVHDLRHTRLRAACAPSVRRKRIAARCSGTPSIRSPGTTRAHTFVVVPTNSCATWRELRTSAVSRELKRRAPPAVAEQLSSGAKTPLSPQAAWPFPTGNIA